MTSISSSSPSIPSALYRISLSIGLCAAIVLVFGPSIHAPFIFDDPFSITNNQTVHKLWPLVGDAEHPGPLNATKLLPTSGRPLVNLSLALNYYFGKLDPVGYHLFNLGVHLLSALLLMAIVTRILRLPYFNDRFDSVSLQLAFAVALLWAVHPLQTESVVYVTQRTELMVGFFYLATLYGSLRYWSAEASAVRTTWLLLAIFCCGAGTACKEVIATAPVIVLLFDRTFISVSFRRALRTSWPLYVGLASSWILLICLNGSGPRAASTGFDKGIPAYVWWSTQAKVLAMYFRLTFWPSPLNIHYELPYLATFGEAIPWVVPALILLVVATILVWRRFAAGFVLAWIIVILSPTLLVPIITEVAAERRMYLPLAGLIALLVVGGFSLLQQWWRPPVLFACALLIAVALAVVSARRVAVYDDPMELWQQSLALQPANALAHNNLGGLLNEAGQPEQASNHFYEAIRLRPTYAEAHYNLGNLLAKSGKHQEAIQHYELATQFKPGYAEAYENMGIEFGKLGNYPEAIANLQEALRIKPDHYGAHNNLGMALFGLGRYPEAIDQYHKALDIDPEYTIAYANLAVAYAATSRPAEAHAAAQRALDLARSQHRDDLIQQLESWLATHPVQQTTPQPPSTKQDGG